MWIFRFFFTSKLIDKVDNNRIIGDWPDVADGNEMITNRNFSNAQTSTQSSNQMSANRRTSRQTCHRCLKQQRT
jgi:hypothetical protein